MLTLDDIDTLAAGLPIVYVKPDVAPNVQLSDACLRKLYTVQTYHESEIGASDGMIAWCAKKHCYRHFETHQNFADFILGSDPGNRYWSERIYALSMQKLRIDYDCKGLRVDIAQIGNEIRDLFQELYGEYLLDCELITCDMSDAEKQSVHFIIDGYYVNSNVEARYFAEKLKLRLGDIGAGIDMQIYSKATGLRAALNSKEVDGAPVRTKTLPAGVDFTSTLITYVHMCRPLPTIAGTIVVPRIVKFNGDPIAAINNIPAKFTLGFVFRSINGNFINFSRTEPSICAISGEMHHRDNTLFGIITDDGIKLKCRHCNGSIISPCEEIKIVASAKQNKVQKGKRIAEICAKAVTCTELKSQSVYSYTGEKNKYGDMMNELPTGPDSVLPHPGTIFVRAHMGVGKTSALRRFMDTAGPATVLAVSFRVSFTAGMCSKFDLKSYRTIVGNIDCKKNKRVIVQCESLHRVRPEAYDMLILDEVQSIIQQMFSQETHHYAMQSWAILEYMIKHSRTVVCMDAYIDQATIDLVTQIRGGTSILHINTAVVKKPRHKIIEKKSAAIAMIMNLMSQGKRVVVPSTSCGLAEKIYAIATKQYPEKKIKLYTSKTPDDVKAADFADVNTAWAGLDLLIFTPTVLAGLSYTGTDYDVAVCLWHDSSVDIFGSLQMIGRVREIISDTYYHYISERPTDMPDSPETLLQYITESYENFIKADAPKHDMAGIFEDGRVKIHDTIRFRTWLNVQSRLNYSRNNFLAAFVRELKLAGCEVSLYVEAEDRARDQLVNIQLKQIGNDINVSTAVAVSASRELTIDEYSEIVAIGNIINTEDRLAITKYQFRRFYSYDREITVDLLLKYGAVRLQHQYLRRKRLRSFNNDIEEGVRGMVNSAISEGVVMGVNVENIKNMFSISRDKIAIELMKIFGMSFDSTYVLSRAELVAKLTAAHEKLVRECVNTCKIFGVKIVKLPAIGDDGYVKCMLDYINGKIDSQYGVKLKATDKHGVKYILYDSHADLFDHQHNIKINN